MTAHILTKDGLKPVTGKRFGALFVHKCLPQDGDHWRITHEKSGYSIGEMFESPTLKTACHMARHLNDLIDWDFDPLEETLTRKAAHWMLNLFLEDYRGFGPWAIQKGVLLDRNS